MNLSALVGNAPLKHQLESQTAQRGLSHAYLISGPAGIGKRTLASLLAAALVCSSCEIRPCTRCSGCRKALSGIHPDVIHTGADGTDITVAQIRALRSDAYIRPNEAERKVYILENAHTMNASAQNALLKLLEEGPAYAAFLLLAENESMLLPTIRSRCEALHLIPISQEEAEAALKVRFPSRTAAELHTATVQCEGILGRAIAQLERPALEADELVKTAAALLDRASSGSELDLASFLISLEKWDRDKISALLDELILLLRDALVSYAGGPEDPDPRRSKTARQAAHALPPAVLLSTMETVKQLRSACSFYVGTGHLCGWLCAAFFRSLHSSTSTPH